MSCYNQCGECKHSTWYGQKELLNIQSCTKKNDVTFKHDTSECELFERMEVKP